MLSFEQLSTPVTEAEAEAEIIARLAELGFSSKGWQSGSVQLTFVKLLAWLYARFTTFVAALLLGAFNDTSTGEFLTRFSASHYDNTRKAAVAFQYTIRHTTAAGEGPHTIGVGDLVATNGVYTYRNIEAGELTSAAPVDLIYQAEVPGAAPVAADGTITTLLTPVSGVTTTNPAESTVQAGADEESDLELQLRNRTKWGLLSINVPADGYKNIALQTTGVGRVAVDDSNPRGPYTIDVYIAGPSAQAGSEAVTTTQTNIDARKSITADVGVIDAPVQVVTVSGIVYYKAAFAGAPEAIDEAVTAYITTLPIGGEELTALTRGIALDALYVEIRKVSGVQNVDLTSPSADLVLSPFRICSVNLSGLTKLPI